MRLISRKLYRAYPELDRFSDAECERFVARARTRLGGWLTTAGIGSGLLGGLSFVVLLATVANTPAIAQWRRRLPPTSMRDLWIALLACVATILIACVVGLVARDRTLRRGFGDFVGRTRCPRCKYSLLGLPSVDGNLCCPECGATLELAELGLVEEDLDPATPRREPTI